MSNLSKYLDVKKTDDNGRLTDMANRDILLHGIQLLSRKLQDYNALQVSIYNLFNKCDNILKINAQQIEHSDKKEKLSYSREGADAVVFGMLELSVPRFSFAMMRLIGMNHM